LLTRIILLFSAACLTCPVAHNTVDPTYRPMQSTLS